jgi:dipeptidyl-peptidase 4
MAVSVVYTCPESSTRRTRRLALSGQSLPEEFYLTRATAVALTAVVVRALIACAVAAQAAANSSAPKRLTVEAIFGQESLLGEPPESIAWSPDGKHLSYLDGEQLIDFDPATGRSHVLVSRAKLASISGANESEVDRDHRQRYNLAGYQWAPDSTHLLFDSNGRLWMYDLRNGTGVQVGYTSAGSGDDPKFSPNGEALAFVRDHGLAVVRLRDSGTPINMVATAPNNSTLNGEVDWVYEEELDVRSNYFWSPDSKSIAYLQMTETDVPQYPIEDWIPTHAQVETQRYPQPGDNNPDVRVGVVNAGGGKTAWVKLPIRGGQDYIPRFGWVDRRTLWIETLSRDHKHRDLYFADAGSGRAHPVLQLSDEKFVDENYDVTVSDGTIVLTDWNDGHNHIYLYRYDGAHMEAALARLDRQLTSGEFEVESVVNVDKEKKQIVYTSNEGNPLEQQLWQTTFEGQRKQITQGAGHHEANLSPSGGDFVDSFSTLRDPPTLSLCHADDKCSVLWQTRALEAYPMATPQELEVKAHDGTPLYATLLLPEGAGDAASVPLIVNPYGGPGTQTVANSWDGGLLFDEVLAEHGFAVLHADNRGMGMRGRAFAQAAYRDFGRVQFEDQLTVVDEVLAKYPQLDGKRMGWWGWSWGGTFTLYALTHSDRFRAGVAVAPVTDWRNYDSIYTERYLGEPAQSAQEYKDFSVVNSAAALKGRLLLVHGTGDDNVHIENSVQFIQKLIESEIPYDLQIYPRKTHSISGSDARTHLFNRIVSHFEQYLKPPATDGAER